MWHELDWEAIAEQEHAFSPLVLTDTELDELVVFERLCLNNQNKPCGAGALRKRLRDHYHLCPLPSRRRIAKILLAYGLTYRRTGWYEGEELDWLPSSSQVPPEQRRYFNMNICCD